MAGKGSSPRPISVPREVFDANWDRIFGTKSENKPNEKSESDLFFSLLCYFSSDVTNQEVSERRRQ